MKIINNMLTRTPDDAIIGMAVCGDEKINLALRLYGKLAHMFTFSHPHFVTGASVRMIQLTMQHGFSPKSSPLGFAVCRPESIFISIHTLRFDSCL